MPDFLNWQDPPTTGAPMSTLIPNTRIVAEPVQSAFNSVTSSVPTVGQLWPRGVNTN